MIHKQINWAHRSKVFVYTFQIDGDRWCQSHRWNLVMSRVFTHHWRSQISGYLGESRCFSQ